MNARLRSATAADAARIAEVEAEASARFRGTAADWLADAGGMDARMVGDHLASGNGIVAETADGIVGFALFGDAREEGAEAEAAGAVYLRELDVVPAWQGRGIASALIAAVRASAAPRPVMVTTFRDLAFNAPFYARRGFRPLGPDEIDGFLARRLAEEAAWARGLPRVAMIAEAAP